MVEASSELWVAGRVGDVGVTSKNLEGMVTMGANNAVRW
jgi:hypothetical protein